MSRFSVCSLSRQSVNHLLINIHSFAIFDITITGLLMAIDSYMNLQLENTEEYINEEFAGNLGQVLIRCNNVLYLRAGEEAPEEA